MVQYLRPKVDRQFQAPDLKVSLARAVPVKSPVAGNVAVSSEPRNILPPIPAHHQQPARSADYSSYFPATFGGIGAVIGIIVSLSISKGAEGIIMGGKLAGIGCLLGYPVGDASSERNKGRSGRGSASGYQLSHDLAEKSSLYHVVDGRFFPCCGRYYIGCRAVFINMTRGSVERIEAFYAGFVCLRLWNASAWIDSLGYLASYQGRGGARARSHCRLDLCKMI